jgi:hypothetical protein
MAKTLTSRPKPSQDPDKNLESKTQTFEKVSRSRARLSQTVLD